MVKTVVYLLEQQAPINVLYQNGINADVLVSNDISMSYWLERGYSLTDLCALGATRDHLRNMRMTVENIFRYKHLQISLELLGDLYDIHFFEIVQDFSGGRLEYFLGFTWKARDLKMVSDFCTFRTF